MEIKKVANLLKTIDAKKAIIAEKRDEIRIINSELVSLLDTLDEGIENIEEGVKLINSGIDSISENL